MDWLQENIFILITALVAVYGAVLSTLNHLASRSERSRQIDVTLSFGFLTYGAELSDTHLLLTAANPGHIPVTIRSGHLELPNNTRAIVGPGQGEKKLPHALQPGQSCLFWQSAKGLALSLKETSHSDTINLRAVFVDAIGSEFKSQALEFDVDRWAEEE